MIINFNLWIQYAHNLPPHNLFLTEHKNYGYNVFKNINFQWRF
jgi:hypothetical protein